jgi:hypothetical protein
MTALSQTSVTFLSTNIYMTSAAQRAIQAIVMAQLKGIERKASSIIFFNEPLGNLNEFQYPFSFPYNALEPLANMPDDLYVCTTVCLSDCMYCI